MEINPFTTGLIIALLVGCSGTSQNTTVEAILTPEQQTPEPTSTVEEPKVSTFNFGISKSLICFL